MQLDAVERGDVVARLIFTVNHAFDFDVHSGQWNLPISCEDLDEFGATGSRCRKYEFARCRCFARTTVLHRTIDDEVLVANRAEHSAKGVRRFSPGAVISRGW